MDKYPERLSARYYIGESGFGVDRRAGGCKIVRSFTDYFSMAITEESLHQLSIVIAFGLITVLHIVLGEQVPKTAAIRNPLTYTMYVSLPLRGFIFYFLLLSGY
jgi:CBS domain containing-hemolysin-like protein